MAVKTYDIYAISKAFGRVIEQTPVLNTLSLEARISITTELVEGMKEGTNEDYWKSLNESQMFHAIRTGLARTTLLCVMNAITLDRVARKIVEEVMKSEKGDKEEILLTVQLRDFRKRKIGVIADEAVYHLEKLKDTSQENEWLSPKGIEVLLNHIETKLEEIRKELRLEGGKCSE